MTIIVKEEQDAIKNVKDAFKNKLKCKMEESKWTEK